MAIVEEDDNISIAPQVFKIERLKDLEIKLEINTFFTSAWTGNLVPKNNIAIKAGAN